MRRGLGFDVEAVEKPPKLFMWKFRSNLTFHNASGSTISVRGGINVPLYSPLNRKVGVFLQPR